MHTIETLTEFLRDRGLIEGSVMSKLPLIHIHFGNIVLEENEIILHSEGLKITDGEDGRMVVKEL